MNIEMAITKFRDHLVEHFSGKLSSRGWIKCDCRTICNACTNKRYKPFYVALKSDMGCFLKCFKISSNLNRFITTDDFDSFGFTDQEAIKSILTRNDLYSVKTIDTKVENWIVNDWLLSKAQKDYLQRRLGFVPQIDELMEYRIIPDVMAEVKENFIEEDKITKLLLFSGVEKGKIGITFALPDSGMLFYRGINNGTKAKINVFDSNPHGYTLQRGDAPKSLIVTEGIFDIINIYRVFANMDNALYVASMGFNSFESTICYHYQQHCDTIDQLIIFADSDVPLPYDKFIYKKTELNRLISRVKHKLGEDAFKKIFICYNARGKDFGDMSSPIEGVRIEVK